MLNIDKLKTRHLRDTTYLEQTPQEALFSQRILATIVGIIALALPFAVLFFDGGYATSCFRFSLSHYFYAPVAGEVFVMAIAFIGAMLIAYRGENRLDNWLATLAGVAALFVAILPTEGIGCASTQAVDVRAIARLSDPTVTEAALMFQLFPAAMHLHFVSAGFVFVILAYFCIFVFRRPLRRADGTLIPTKGAKLIRNIIYTCTGAAISLCIVAMLLNAIIGFEGWNENNLTFYAESIAVCCFGVAWIIKGKLFNLVLLDDTPKVTASETYPD